MNVVVLHQNTGNVTAWRIFDTYSTTQESEEMMEFISDLPDGRILCLAVKVCQSAAASFRIVWIDNTIARFKNK